MSRGDRLSTMIRLVFAGYAIGDAAPLAVRPERALSKHAGWNTKFLPHTSNEDSPIAELLSTKFMILSVH